jgi:hypothetical protein
MIELFLAMIVVGVLIVVGETKKMDVDWLVGVGLLLFIIMAIIHKLKKRPVL